MNTFPFVLLLFLVKNHLPVHWQKIPNLFDFDAIFPIEWVPVPVPMGRKKTLERGYRITLVPPSEVKFCI